MFIYTIGTCIMFYNRKCIFYKEFQEHFIIMLKIKIKNTNISYRNCNIIIYNS